MKRCCVALSALALAACGPTGAPDDAAPDAPEPTLPTPQYQLLCADFAQLSAEQLRQNYGAENVTDQTLPGPEGESYAATVLYPNDPTRRLEIVWRDGEAQAAPANVIASGESQWETAHGVSIGDPLDEVERLNGQPFSIYGFAWDYGGTVANWNGGALAPQGNCSTRVRFEAAGDTSGARGDSEFSSDAPGVRAAQARVREVALVFE